ncbi:MAG: shikimate dehydrogenase [bacterium]
MAAPNLVFLLGDPVGHSLSPAFQNAAFQAAGIPWSYRAQRVDGERLDDVLDALALLGLGGANITVPHKEGALGSMDSLDREASIVGAVNTVCITKDGLRGSNTDVDGFLAALGEEVPGGLKRPAVVILGAGGAARAAAWALVRDGWTEHIAVVNRTLEKGQVLINTLREGEARKGGGRTRFDLFRESSELTADLKAGTGLVVNATPLGQGALADQTPLEGVEGFPEETFVFDLVYGVRPTPLVRLARAAGLSAADGKKMLLHQGARSFELWTGQSAPLEVMRDALESAARSQGR